MAFAKLREATITVEALVLIAFFHKGGYICPFLGILLVEFQKLVVFLTGPGLHFALVDVLVLLFDFHIDVFSLLGQQANHKLFLHSSIK